MENFIFFDTETTGNTEKDVLCQIAYKHGVVEFSELYKPSIPIPPEASAVHHITNKMVEKRPAFRDSTEYLRTKTLFEKSGAIPVAHNAKFDVDMFKKEGIVVPPFICTLRLSRYLDKENKIPRYNLQFLRYFLGIEIDAQAHDALGDVKVLEALFERLKAKLMAEVGEDKAVAEMLAISARPSLMHTFTFGKHNEKSIADVAKIDRGYLEWLLAQKMQNENDEEDWIYTLKHYLGRE